MAKKGKKRMGLVDMILVIVGAVGAVLSFVALAFSFVTVNVTNPLTNKVTGTDKSLSDWMSDLDSMNEANAAANKINADDVFNVGGYNLARVFLFVTLVLVAITAILLLVKFLMNNKLMNMLTMVAAALTIVSALVFMIAMLVGNAPFATELSSRAAGLGVWFVTIGAIIAGAMGIATSRQLK